MIRPSVSLWCPCRAPCSSEDRRPCSHLAPPPAASPAPSRSCRHSPGQSLTEPGRASQSPGGMSPVEAGGSPVRWCFGDPDEGGPSPAAAGAFIWRIPPSLPPVLCQVRGSWLPISQWDLWATGRGTNQGARMLHRSAGGGGGWTMMMRRKGRVGVFWHDVMLQIHLMTESLRSPCYLSLLCFFFFCGVSVVLSDLRHEPAESLNRKFETSQVKMSSVTHQTQRVYC